MTDELKQFLKEIFLMLGGGFSGWLITNIRPKQVREDEHDKNQNATIEIQGRTLEDAWNKIDRQQKAYDELEKRFRELDDKLVLYMKAYYKSLKFIRDKLPGVDVPDFLKETDPKIVKPSA